MSSFEAKPLEMFCSRYGVSIPFDMERIRAGRNSEVWRLFNADGQWILKNYYQHSGDERDRLGTEFGFLRFLSNAGVRGVAQPLGIDRSSHRALYSFLPGKRPGGITSSHITQAANFIAEINKLRTEPEAMALPKAADSCFSWQDHLELTKTRIGRLMTMRPESDLEVEAHALVKEQFLPLWLRLRNKMLHEIETSQLAEPLPFEARILSPSDFGFHNTLEDEGNLVFVDFEYAGWDDPAKLICDFIGQPELPASESQGWQFRKEILRNLPHPGTIEHRVEHLLPVHRLKWCCILLNEFRVEGRKRRFHAGVESDGLLADQLSKAKHYFNVHLALLN
jgi:hypothetical protein